MVGKWLGGWFVLCALAVACSDPQGSTGGRLREGNSAAPTEGDDDDAHGDQVPGDPPNDDPDLGSDPPTGGEDENDENDQDAGPKEEDKDAGSDVVPGARAESPVPGKSVTYPYGVKNDRYAAGYHTGEDYAAPTGAKVVAVRNGVIRWSNDNGGAYGKWMGLEAENGRTYVYCHLSVRGLKSGTKVKAGDVIGKVGATGNVTGPHLHFEDHPVGPFKYAKGRKPSW